MFWLFLAFLNLVCSTVVKGDEKQICQIPAICSAGEVSTTEWLKIDYQERCENTASNTVSSPENTNHREIKLQTLENALKNDFENLRSQLFNLSYSLYNGTNKKLKDLQVELRELNSTFEKTLGNLQSELISNTTTEWRRIRARLDTLNNISEQDFILLRSHLENITFTLLNATEKKIAEIQNQLKLRDVSCRDVNGTFYRGRCHWIILQPPTNFASSKTLCEAYDGVIGDVSDKFYYDLIVGMTQAQIPSSVPVINIWTGMTINPTTEEITPYTTNHSTFTTWLTGWPRTFSDYTNIPIRINKNPAHANGMWNYPPTYGAYGVLCQDKQ